MNCGHVVSVDAAPSVVPAAFATGPTVKATDGGVVGDLCRLVGFDPDPEQQLVLDALFAYRDDGSCAAFETAVIAPRQNLKTGLAKQAVLGWLFVTGERLVVWSAHEFRTAQEAFRDFTELIESSPDLEREVKAIYRGNGDEAIETVDGARLIFKARTKGGGRGLTGDKVVLDEAFALRPVHMGSLLPTLAARRDPQVLYASSAGMVDSEVLRSIRDRGRSGTDPRLAYFEWADLDTEGCATEGCDHHLGATGCALDDPARWAKANPALGRRIDLDTLTAFRQAMPPEEFAREFLGWWDEPVAADDANTAAEWVGATTQDAPTGVLALAADVAPAHTFASVVVCGDGVLEVVERRRGASWLPERLAELVTKHDIAQVVIDPAGPIGSLIPELERAEIPLLMLGGRDAVNACTGVEVAIRDGEVRHRGEPELLNAVGGARRRKVGDGWKWTRVDSTIDISPLVAATYAWWGWQLRANEPIDYDIRFI